ncbi:hypothetical protein PYCCODRAFT_268790 [Trametes coccinea BRFM310]|uniref:Uncharacterized protein n=1 Tax=Trametes coccinea (strain BRFM310) TaxID=1353009 RepID=A0A1Y2IQG4_TRAC3|nr:hypothetical protein PYCCODRAFT_268790 [Trametes coccinea BRFM310]
MSENVTTYKKARKKLTRIQGAFRERLSRACPLRTDDGTCSAMIDLQCPPFQTRFESLPNRHRQERSSNPMTSIILTRLPRSEGAFVAVTVRDSALAYPTIVAAEGALDIHSLPASHPRRSFSVHVPRRPLRPRRDAVLTSGAWNDGPRTFFP